jgi:carbonic anhydrase
LLFLICVGEYLSHCKAEQKWHYEGHKRSLHFNHVTSSSAFGYEGETGPQHWNTLNSTWALCGSGTEQSPVSLGKDTFTSGNPHNLEIFWEDLTSPVELINNGHTFEIEVATNEGGKSSHITWDGTQYNLLQFHFHQNSEHHVDKRSYPIEMHLVHQSDAGNLLVIGVFLDKSAAIGKNQFLEQFWDLMPKSESSGEVEIEFSWLYLKNYISTDSYWSYPGSLTTPPCKEGVQWVVLSKKIPISYNQWTAFQRVNGFNARFTQPLNSRTI